MIYLTAHYQVKLGLSSWNYNMNVPIMVSWLHMPHNECYIN